MSSDVPITVGEDKLVYYHAAFATELAGELVLVILSVFVLNVLRQYAALHANLRIFLALKCLASLSFGIARAILTARLVKLPSYSLYPPAWVAFISGVGAGVNSQLCWAYTAERILATVCVKTYERQRPWFGCVAGGFIVASSVFLIARDTLRYGHVLITFELIVGGFGTQALGIVCILIILLLRCLNTRRYRKDSEYTHAVHLSARYQNSENVRTTCQLTPLILLHLLSGFSLNSLFVAEYLNLTNEQKFLQLVVVNLTNCFLYIGCQISVLYFHNGVSKTARSRLVRLCCVRARASPCASGSDTQRERLKASVNTSVYFNTLTAEWDQKFEKRLSKV